MAADARSARALGALAVGTRLALVAAAIAVFLVWSPPAAAVHGAAQACASCHHATPPSFAPCLSCHSDAYTPNRACTLCHPGKTTTGATCWACHAPGTPMPAPTDENCAACHGPVPHLGSSPTCTACHGVDPTPHHDDVDQQAPSSCVSCHQHAGRQTHGAQPCTVCHDSVTHPDYPAVPDTCNGCHPAATFGVSDCSACHDGTPYNGVSDDDIHDEGIPDPPIGATGCTSCHPDRQPHAGALDCGDCHVQAAAFHHGQAQNPGFPQCTDCHGQRPQHGQGLACESCHRGAQHQADPPTPPSSVCRVCHAETEFGTKDCYRCHAPPIYHVAPSVGPCSACHGGGRAYHAGKVKCGTCHTNVRSGHHLGRVTARSCTSRGCHAQQKHVGKVWCTQCHGRAQHDRTPLNLPANPWSVCQKCHTFTDQALLNGVPACSECHDAVQHNAAYRVDPCTDCHMKEPHQGYVDCRSCHVDPGPGHHRVGAVGVRDCADCHLGAEVHASATHAGRDMTCSACHDGPIHGIQSDVTDAACKGCHPNGELHADRFGCTDCHWPAVHAGLPDPARYGARAPLPLDPGGALADEAEPRDRYPATGADLIMIFGGAVLLIAVGLLLRRASHRSGRRGPPAD
jgi:hypothetical protein